MTAPTHLHEEYRIKSKNVDSGKEFVTSNYLYRSTKIHQDANGAMIVEPVERYYMFRTDKRVPKVGVLLVGIGGNNGTTVTGAVLANKHNISWNTKEGTQFPNYFGSLSQATTTFLGCNQQNQQVYVPLKTLIPMVDPNDLVIHGWDINDAPLDKAMNRACVFDYGLQEKLAPYLKEMKPMKSIYYPDFIASNQTDRANNVYEGDRACEEHLNIIRNDIKQFQTHNELDKVIVIWTANTERYSDVINGVHDTEDNFLGAIKNGHSEIAPSQMFAAASILEGCAFVNGSPQNTFCPALIEMARKRGVFIGGDDFKSGQTKIKSVLVDFLVASGIKPESIVSYNHLGNNDGKNLDEAKQFRSKEISKSNVVDDVVNSNKILYGESEKPDHCVVIKYVPAVKDSKRAMDEYTSRIFMNGLNTIVLHNTCEDSLLAAPIIIDLIIFTELFQRIEWKLTYDQQAQFEKFDSILTMLSFLLKAPLVPDEVPLVNALFKQRACIENILRACVGLPPINDMLLEYKTVQFKKQCQQEHD
jgi:myo-inositol-1-phosphate synthase